MDSAALLCLVKIGGKVIDLLRAIGAPLPGRGRSLRIGRRVSKSKGGIHNSKFPTLRSHDMRTTARRLNSLSPFSISQAGSFSRPQSPSMQGREIPEQQLIQSKYSQPINPT